MPTVAFYPSTYLRTLRSIVQWLLKFVILLLLVGAVIATFDVQFLPDGVPDYLTGIFGQTGFDLKRAMQQLNNLVFPCLVVFSGLYGASYYKTTPLFCSCCCSFLCSLAFIPILMILCAASMGGLDNTLDVVSTCLPQYNCCTIEGKNICTDKGVPASYTDGTAEKYMDCLFAGHPAYVPKYRGEGVPHMNVNTLCFPLIGVFTKCSDTSPKFPPVPDVWYNQWNTEDASPVINDIGTRAAECPVCDKLRATQSELDDPDSVGKDIVESSTPPSLLPQNILANVAQQHTLLEQSSVSNSELGANAELLAETPIVIEQRKSIPETPLVETKIVNQWKSAGALGKKLPTTEKIIYTAVENKMSPALSLPNLMGTGATLWHVGLSAVPSTIHPLLENYWAHVCLAVDQVRANAKVDSLHAIENSVAAVKKSGKLLVKRSEVVVNKGARAFSDLRKKTMRLLPVMFSPNTEDERDRRAVVDSLTAKLSAKDAPSVANSAAVDSAAVGAYFQSLAAFNTAAVISMVEAPIDPSDAPADTNSATNNATNGATDSTSADHASASTNEGSKASDTDQSPKEVSKAEEKKLEKQFQVKLNLMSRQEIELFGLTWWNDLIDTKFEGCFLRPQEIAFWSAAGNTIPVIEQLITFYSYFGGIGWLLVTLSWIFMFAMWCCIPRLRPATAHEMQLAQGLLRRNNSGQSDSPRQHSEGNAAGAAAENA